MRAAAIVIAAALAIACLARPLDGAPSSGSTTPAAMVTPPKASWQTL